MKNETIQPLKKLIFSKKEVFQEEPSSCCGGAPESDEDACCKLDEEKKAGGESGCGCNSAPLETKAKSSCC